MNRVCNLDRFAARLCQHMGGGAATNPGDLTVEPDPHQYESNANSGTELSFKNFNDLALELFHLQFESNDAYRRQSQARGVLPNQIQTSDQISIAPSPALKELGLSFFAPGKRTTVYFA